MTARKSPSSASLALPKEIAVPYPPADIWKGKEQGESFEFRGNTFVRRGAHVTRVLAKEGAGAAEAKNSG